jgi:hypothetical protein
VKFMMIHYLDQSLVWSENGLEGEDPEETRVRDAWDEEMAARGILLGGGVLRGASEAKTLKVRNGEVLLTDGPFAETKEQIAGYTVLECADMEEAIEVAARHPTATFGAFELRPYQYI